MYMNDTKSLKHEFRTPVNHIIGYSALLREAAEDQGNELLGGFASDIQALGAELNRTADRTLLFTDHSLQTEDIHTIREAVAPLISRIEERLASCFKSAQEDSEIADLQRIKNAVARLGAILDEPLFHGSSMGTSCSCPQVTPSRQT